MRTPKHLRDPTYSRHHIGPSQPQPHRLPTIARRIVFVGHGDDGAGSVSIWGWPSRGGLVVLEHATALDFTFLGLDPASMDPDPATRRNLSDPHAEDALCRDLLRLGAKWFDSLERYGFVANVAAGEDQEILALEAGEESLPSTMERRWVSVGIPPLGEDEVDKGFWVLECDTVMYGMQEKHNLVPPNAAHVQLARSMDEKCEILKKLGAKHYSRLDDYDGEACLNAWKTKTSGEFGPLVKTEPSI